MLKKLKQWLATNSFELAFFGSIGIATGGFALGSTLGFSIAMIALAGAAATMMRILVPHTTAPQPAKPPNHSWDRFSVEQKSLIKELWKKNPQELVVEKDGIKITGEHMARLKDCTWLSDEMINYYFKMLPNQTPDSRPVHRLSSFFFSELTNPKKGIPSVRRWMKNIPTLEGQLLIPVNVSNKHWCLGVVDFDKKAFQYFDSLGGSGAKFFKHIKLFLKDQKEHHPDKFKDFDFDSWAQECPKDIPHQKNKVDCGVFTLLYARAKTQQKPFDFGQEDIGHYRRQFTLECYNKKLL